MTLPPGRARLSTNPAPTGSATCTNTVGTVRVACRNAGMIVSPEAKTDVGRERDQFGRRCAAVGIGRGPARVEPHVATDGPAQLPQRLSERLNAGLDIPGAAAMSTPMRRIPPGCCALAASGHPAAPPPSSVMNSRRFNESNCIDARQQDPIRKLSHWRGCVRWHGSYFT